MHARREEASRPAWDSDQLDSPIPPEVEAAYFDEALDSWVLSRHEDVLAAFRSSTLAPTGPRSEKTSTPEDEGALLKMREETLDALSPTQLRAWRERLMPFVHTLVQDLPEGQGVDLLAEYARPACLALAAIVTGIELGEAERLQDVAQAVSAAAAEPYDPILRSEAKLANAQLRPCFHAGPETLRDSGFVALSHTMPRLLGNAWYALLQHPQEWSLLHLQPDLVEQAIEESLRYAGLTRVLFRRATEDIDLGGCPVRRGDRIVLRIIAANRDPERFAHPNLFDSSRREAGQLALGAGPHSCVGASLIRMAAIAITRPLVERFAMGTVMEAVSWHGGSGFRSPVSLRVLLQGSSHQEQRAFEGVVTTIRE
ncbi:cytochrome P450 [Granulicella sp. dw_53]|uniref:cytochrome P450 n=1 Tax=Granulicella sp. dw_53 TaxID=2719792 RepID=UPI001BD5C40D|nr:cytochrome P450 [Granulicella sp. dw_53]